MTSIFQKIDIFGSTVQLSFQHQTHHKTCCGGIFTILLVMIFGVAFWIQGQDVIYKSNPNINFSSNAVQSPKFDLSSGYLPIAFGLRRKRDLSYIEMDSSTAFAASISIEQIDTSKSLISPTTTIPVNFVQCSSIIYDSNNNSNSARTTQESIETSSWNVFLNYIGEQNNNLNLYCILFNKNSENASNYFLQNDNTNQSRITLNINKCTNQSACLATTYDLSQIDIEIVFVDHALNFTDRDKPLQETPKTEHFSISSNFQKQIFLQFSHIEISTEDSMFFNEISQYNTGLFLSKKDQDMLDMDSNNSVLVSISFEISPNTTSYRRLYKKLSSIIAEIGGLSKALMFAFALIVTPFAKIDFQTSLMNEIFYFDDDEDTENKKVGAEEETIYMPDSVSPGLPNRRHQQQIYKQNAPSQQNVQTQMTGLKNNQTNNSIAGFPLLFQTSTQSNVQELKNIDDIAQPNLTSNKQDIYSNNMHKEKLKNNPSFLKVNRRSLKDTETTISINKNRRSEFSNIPVYDSPEKGSGSNDNIQTNGGEDQNSDKNNNQNNTYIQNNLNQNNHQNDNNVITNKNIDLQMPIIIEQLTSYDINNNSTIINNNNNQIKNQINENKIIPPMNLRNSNNDLNTSIKAVEQSPIKKQSISKKFKRGFTADQNYISTILHEYQETHDPDSAKLRKRKSLRKQGDGDLRKIFTPKSGGLIFKAYEYILYYIFPIGKIKKKKQQLEYTLEKINDRLDAVFIINKLIEIDKLKMLILNENQLKLFDYMPNPVINNLTQKQQMQKLQQEQQMNNQSIKGLSLKLKSAATQDDSKFKTTWSILDSEKTTLMKAHEAYTAFNRIKDDHLVISEIDKNLISMLDPQILSYFENTRKQIYYQRQTETTPIGVDYTMNKGAQNFQILSNQVIYQENEIKKRESLLLQQLQDQSNCNFETNNNTNNKEEINIRTEQIKSMARLSNDKLSEQQSPSLYQRTQTINELSPEKRQMLMNESSEIAHESYFQNKTVFTEFAPTKNLNTSLC